MLTFFSNTVTQVKPYGSFKNVLRTVVCTCKAPSVKKKKKKKRIICPTCGSYLWQQYASLSSRGIESSSLLNFQSIPPLKHCPQITVTFNAIKAKILERNQQKSQQIYKIMYCKATIPQLRKKTHKP